MTERFTFSMFPTLETERLTLREIVPDDADAIFAIRSDFEVTQHNIGRAYTERKQAEMLIKSIHEAYDAHREIRWGMTLKPDDTVIGMAGYNYWDRTDNRASIGFDLRRDHWRRGIMSEGVKRIIQFGFEWLHLNRIEADASVYNTASINLLTSLGFVQEGLMRQQYFENGAYHDLLLFALLRDEWQQEP